MSENNPDPNPASQPLESAGESALDGEPSQLDPFEQQQAYYARLLDRGPAEDATRRSGQQFDQSDHDGTNAPDKDPRTPELDPFEQQQAYYAQLLDRGRPEDATRTAQNPPAELDQATPHQRDQQPPTTGGRGD